jgi:shikimate dehydrogenase
LSDFKQYGLIGKSLKHSFSKSYFNKKFKDLDIIANYENFELSQIEDFSNLISTKQFAGLNVTIPYKETIIPFLDEVDSLALEVGAVNTIQFKNGKTIGYNTDVYGFKQMIKPFFKSHHERAIILGTGGASKAVAFVLNELGCEPIYISRHPNKDHQFNYDEINDIMIQSCPIIINTTPVGMYPNISEMPKIPTEYLSEKNLVIDLIYNPAETELLKKAKEKKAWTLNGLTMLQQQAEKAWQIWNAS